MADGTASAPRRMRPEEAPAVLALVQAAFAFMDGRIDPPSSMHRLTAEAVAAQDRAGEVWVIAAEGGILACVFLTEVPGAIYLGKLAVTAAARGRGLAGRLVETAAARAWARGLSRLELQSRVELTENHAAFRRMGFVETGRTAHPGHPRPTSVSFARAI